MTFPHVNTTEGPVELPMEHKTKEHRFEPYDFNGGTVLAVAGKDFVVVAGDTRLSTGYSILSRDETKIHEVAPNVLLASPGSFNDVVQLRGVLGIRSQMYQHDNEQPPTIEAMAQLLMNTLYQRRFFPYYSFCLLCGITKDGKGAVYEYDAVGSHKNTSRGAQGSGGHLMMPLLDNLVTHEGRSDPLVDLTIEQTKMIIKDAFVTAGERDIYTGDKVEIFVITAHGTTKEEFLLKQD
ncbi:hypothetical protein H257_07021 [Aphanomyces astaci]|uniref:Proteasome subunit beta n=2 Tax=Aphanomyces astaci TaxID=112090 RepID=W4GL80_APHAT|nr:hypothetical protein H257_07021 [Aphanomyces astaci]ETV79799.1 hypothetical protein H257_07021 [Aphanomyces astaci]KAF0706374.1 hypothetical protein AaE_014149 [Aphanomyces astaci]RHY21302.1 hypothetical protein DYB36_012919 [Aphanomyces astaci]RHY48806.1 hypothetical protein DYB30_010889 [Aphanomyces astaci]RHY52594.1 hypothetical protein DYB34_004360 [Aphanomyces astaci]|eukprot:XP_009830735.1 hypothetical protein H257_07021 [Aphanomyces astaci]